MDEHENIFEEDVRDSSYLQIVSSDEEDLCCLKSPSNFGAKNTFKSNSSSNKSNYYDEKFDRYIRLDKSLESDSNLDTQNIIDEINKIFEKSEASQEEEKKEKEETLLTKGKRIINKIKSRIISVSDGLLTPRSDDSKIPSKNKRRRATTNSNYSYQFDFGDAFSPSNSDPSLEDDEEYNPEKGLEVKRKRSLKNKSTNPSKKNKKINVKKKVNSEGKRNLEKSKILDKFGFDNSNTLEEDSMQNENDQEFEEGREDMLCLKFVVMDQNKNLINDSRLESVFIKSSERLGNIAKKIGEMYNLKEEEYGKIKIIIDGEAQNHNLEIGDPELGVENKMQIDIKFPPKEDLISKIEDVKKPREPKRKIRGGRQRPRGSSLSTPGENTENEVVEID